MYRLKVDEIRRLRGLSQNELSRRANLNIDTVRNVLRNHCANVQVDTLDRLAQVLDVDVSELIESVPEGKRLNWDAQ